VPFLRHFIDSPDGLPIPSSSTEDVKHITEEMYKKNAELAQRNKTLSILRKIDEIILGSVTDLHQIAQEVCSILVSDADYKIVSLFLHDKAKRSLVRIGFGQTPALQQVEQSLSSNVSVSEIPLSSQDNIIIQAFRDKRIQITTSFADILMREGITVEQANHIQELSNIKLSVVFPLIVRNDILGTMVVSFSQLTEQFSEYERDLLDRLVSMVGIALDNALLYNEVQDSNVKLQALDKLKDDFVSLASHELRTPMTAIKSYLWMALAGKGGEISGKLKFYLQRAYDATDRLIKLVNDMLNISRIESGRITISIQRVSLVKLVQDVVFEVMPRAQELGVKLSVTASLGVPDVIADSDKIKEVLINLIGNSLKFTPANGTITVSFFIQNGVVKTIIKDTGSGILPEDIPKLFQKFGFIQESYITNLTANSGTGLGLYISKAIVELHEGTIVAESEGRGKGATFSFTLRVYTSDDLARLQKRFHSDEQQVSVGLIHRQL